MWDQLHGERARHKIGDCAAFCILKMPAIGLLAGENVTRCAVGAHNNGFVSANARGDRGKKKIK